MNIKLINQYNLQKLHQKSSWGHRWETRCKLIATMLLIIGIVYLHSLPLLSLTFGIIFIAALSMGLPFIVLFTRLVVILPFFLLMGIPILFGGGYPLSVEALQFLLTVTFKGFSSLLLMIIVIYTQSPQEIFNGMAYMKIPSALLSVFFLAYRYLFLFINDLQNTRKALISRSYRHQFSKENMKLYGQLAGGILIKSIDTSETVYKAMISRGFEGKIPTSLPKKVSSIDLLKTILVACFTISIILLEGWLI